MLCQALLFRIKLVSAPISMQSDLPIEHVLPIPNVQLVNHSNFLQTHISHFLHLTCLLYVFIFFPPTERKNTHTSGKHHQTLHQHRLKVPQGQCIPLCPDLTGKTWWKAWIVTDLHHLCSAVDTWPRELFQLEFTRIPRTKNLATHMTHITARNVLRHPSRLVSGWLKTNSNTKTWWKLLGLGKANKSWAWLRLSFWGI